MKIQTITRNNISLTLIEAEDGYVLHRPSNTEDIEPAFGTKAYIASTDSADNWMEMPKAQADELIARYHQSHPQPDEFAAYNDFAEQCKAQAARLAENE